MDMRLVDRSPPKRRRTETPATQFIASPVSISKDEALRWKEADRGHVQLRYISSEAISESDALRESPRGFQVCVSPHASGTNNYIQALIANQERADTTELYMTALYSSIPLCVADLTMVPMYLLDYHLRRLFLDRKQNATDPKRYQALLVGKGKRKPFKGTQGDQIRYGHLLGCYLKLVGERGEGGEDGEERGEGGEDGEERDAGEQLAAFKDLLQSSEECLAAGMSYCGAGGATSSQIRAEARAYLEGEEKGMRDTGAHLFTQLFYQQRRTPLEKQHLEDTRFPPENEAVFRLSDRAALARMGLKVLALADIEKRLNLPAESPFKLTSAAPTLVRAGVEIVKCFMRIKGDVRQPIEFKYGSLTATLGEGTPTRSMDLLTPGP